MKTIYLFILIYGLSFSQVKQKDSLFFRKLSTTKIHKNIRVGLGIQRNFQSEIGYSRMQFTNGCTGFFAKTYYSSIEYVPKTENYNNIIGLKIGLEYNLSILAVGLETKYLTDFDNKNFVIAPKIGLGFGVVNAFYSYNIRFNKNPFPSLNNHQFSLVFNVPITSKEK